MTAANPTSVPLSRSKTAALSRVVDLVAKGYHFYCAGRCPAARLPALARKFHERYGVACSPAQRMQRKQQGLANAALVLFLPTEIGAERSGCDAQGDSTSPCLASSPDAALASGAESGKTPVSRPVRTLQDALHSIPDSVQVEWLLLATPGAGAVHEQESLRSVTDKPRLVFCAYELVRHPVRARAVWTWRRTHEEMAGWFALLQAQLRRRRFDKVALSLQRIASQPGFAGVREQSWRLCQFARQHGFEGELPYLYFLPKVAQGERCLLQDRRGRLT